MDVDPIRMEVFRQSIIGIAEEMGMKMKRAAFSTIIKERDDRSCAFFTPALEMVAQADHLPSHLGLLVHAVKNAILRVGPENLRPGDITIHNDPFIGGSHLPDITTIMPVFVDGEILAYNAVIAHWTDVGGRAPGSLAGDAKSIVEEGLRLPPMKMVEEGEVREDLLELILSNVRVPDDIRGDLRAQLAANRVGEQRFRELAKKFGKDELKELMAAIIDYSYRRTRREIGKLPDGVYTFEDVVDDDGSSDAPLPIRVRVDISGEDMKVDFTDSAAQRPGPVNAVLSVTHSATYFTLKCLIDPNIPTNSGVFRSVEILAPAGTIVNARPPAAVGGGSLETSQRIVDTLVGCFSQFAPDRMSAAGSGTFNCVTFGGYDTVRNRPFVILEQNSGGGGGRKGHDGLKVSRNNISNTPNNPIEVVEAEFPLRVECYEFLPDSGGAGQWVGGLGARKVYRLLADQTITILADRIRTPPWGVLGGEPGRNGRYVVQGKNGERELRSKSTTHALAGEAMVIETTAGGGYGPPEKRDPAWIERDLRAGYFTPEKRARGILPAGGGRRE
ncbi:MAG: hydantoinase B/oxoprolinase family protein [Nitrospinota bacterium]